MTNNRQHTNLRTGGFLSGVLAMATAAAFLAGCATRKATPFTEDLLQSSGFKIVAATTPADKAQLETLRPGKLTVVHRDGKTWYVYPDRARAQLYVGNPAQYQAYRRAYQDAHMVQGAFDSVLSYEDTVTWTYGGLDFGQ